VLCTLNLLSWLTGVDGLSTCKSQKRLKVKSKFNKIILLTSLDLQAAGIEFTTCKPSSNTNAVNISKCKPSQPSDHQGGALFQH